METKMKDVIRIRQHAQAEDMIELYTIRKTSRGDEFVLWGAVHMDMLDGMGFDYSDDKVEDFKLGLEYSPQ
jgi:hypothetical protein